MLPLDPYYKESAEHDVLKTKKTELRKALAVLRRDAKGGVPG
jgi:hypothetical protein